MVDASAQLSRALADFMQKHKRVYGTEHILPKHHWLFDICEQMLRDPLVLDAFIVERLHLKVKDHASRVDTSVRRNRAVLSGILNQQLQDMRGLRLNCCSLGRTCKAMPGYTGAYLAHDMDALGMRISTGDLVFCNDVVGEVTGCATESGEYFVIVEELQFICKVSPWCTRWQIGSVQRVWPALHVEQALAWIQLPNGHVDVLR